MQWFSNTLIGVALALCYACSSGAQEPPVRAPDVSTDPASAEKPNIETGVLLEEPKFAIQSVIASGQVHGDRADLTITFEAVVHSGGWVRIPLRLGQCLLVKEQNYEGGGQNFLDLKDARGGFEWFVRNSEASPREPRTQRLTAHFSVPLETIAGETLLRFTAPRSARSELSLVAPGENKVGSLQLGAEMLKQPVVEGGKTTFHLHGLNGQFALAWHRAALVLKQASSDLQAELILISHIRGGLVRTDATLNVRSFGGEFDRFHVRLPRGVELLTDDARIARVTGGGESSKQGELLEVRHEKTVGPVELRLSYQRAYDVEAAGQPPQVELAGLDVLDAVLQLGYVALLVEDDWQVLWDPSHPGVRQIPVETLPEELRGENYEAALRLSRRGASLKARVVRRKTRVTVEPEYTYVVGAQELSLDAQFKYTVRGSSLFQLHIAVPEGWQIDEVGPEHLVDVDSLRLDETAPLVIPLKQGMIDAFQISIRARREIRSDSTSVRFLLPRPEEVHNVYPAQVRVQPANNVTIIPQSEAIVGLVPQRVPPGRSGEYRQAPWTYRADVAPRTEFAADYKLNPRSVEVRLATEMSIEDQQAQLEQRLTYTVEYESIGSVVLQLPAALAALKEVKYSVDNAPAAPIALQDAAGAEDGQTHVKLECGERLGSFDVYVRFSVPIDQVLPDRSVAVTAPLASPVDAVLLHNEVTVSSSPTVEVLKSFDSPWTLASEESRRRNSVVRLTAGQVADHVTVKLGLRDTGQAQGTIVQRGWLQSRLGQEVRVDRLVLRFTSTGDSLPLFLPPSIDGSATVLLDGVRVSAESAENGVRIAVPSDGGQHTLEVYYRVAQGLSDHESTLVVASPGEEVLVRQMYWQLVVPGDFHLFSVGGPLASENAWHWLGTHWARTPALDQQTLEDWTAAEYAEPTPVSSNAYLFSTSSRIGSVSMDLRSRRGIVLLAALTTLLVGLAVIYIPTLRSPGILLAVTIGLAAAVAVYPDQAMLLAQPCALGVTLVLVAVVLRKLLTRGTAPPSAVRTASSSILERDSTEPQRRRGASVSQQSSTLTAPLTIPVGDRD